MSIIRNIVISPVKAEDFTWDFAKDSNVALRWLGQAGFQILYKNYHLMIDPYLSNHLAKKYAGTEFSHIRMTPSPLAVSEINDLDFILCTHRHSDHMDPKAIPILLTNHSNCKIVVPKAEKQHVLENIGVGQERVIFVNANENIELVPGVSLDVIPSAHEELKADEDGNHHYLGYVLKLGGLTIYHSGDCVPYVGLTEELKRRKIDIALLPVNGRDEYRQSRGVPGNFTFEESLQLCKDAEIPVMICHHFGMFDFNTLDKNILVDKAKAVAESRFKCIVPQTDLTYKFAF